jgi:hypothetical protein
MNDGRWALFNMEEILNFIVDSHQLINVNIRFSSFFWHFLQYSNCVNQFIYLGLIFQQKNNITIALEAERFMGYHVHFYYS